MNVRSKKRSGFTLAELLVVVVIIGLLAGGITTIMGATSDKTRYATAEKDLDALTSAITQAYNTMGGFGGNVSNGDLAADRFPTNFSRTIQAFLTKPFDEFTDPWGIPYRVAQAFTASTGRGYVYVYAYAAEGGGTATIHYKENATTFTSGTINNVRINPYNNDTLMGRTVYNGM